MKLKTLIISILFLTSFTFLSAQNRQDTTKVSRSVVVERDFQPVIQDAGKIISAPEEIEVEVKKIKPVYSDFTTPIQISFTPNTLQPEWMVHKQEDVTKGLLRLGAGYPLNTLGEFMYPIVNDKNNRLDFSIRHLGVWGDKTHSKTKANLQFDHLFENFDLFTGISATHDYFNYYGRYYGTTSPFILSEIANNPTYSNFTYKKANDTTTYSMYDIAAFPLNNTHWRVNAHVGIKSLPEQTDDINYLIDLQYNTFNASWEKTGENHLKMDGKLEIPFNDSRLGFNAEINNLQYTVPETFNFNFPEVYSVVKLNLYYKITGEAGFIKLGGKTGISNEGTLFTPSPDVYAQWNASPEYIALYAGATGDLTINSMSKIYDENRYLITPLKIKDTYTPLDAFVGIKFKPVYNLLFDLYGRYKFIDNQYFYVNQEYTSTDATDPNLTTIYQNRFDVVYSKAKLGVVGLRADYNYKKKLNISLKGEYNYWQVDDEEYAWQLPALNIDFGANVFVTKQLSINTQVFYQNGRYAKLNGNAVLMNPALDINLGADYIINKNVSLFVKLNNLINSNYDTYYGYQVQGINGLVGATFSF